MIQAVVLAGGKGTRLRAVTGDLPKPLAPADGRPLLERQLAHFAASGIRDVIVLTGHGAREIADYCGDGSAWGLSVRCVAEPEALGTAGAVRAAEAWLAAEFMVTYADTVFDFDVARMVAAHRASGATATLFLHPNDHPQDSDLVELDDEDRILAFHPYPHPAGAWIPNLVNAGIYVMNRSVLGHFSRLPARPDFGKHVFPALLRAGVVLLGYRSPEYVKDAGTPDRLAQVSRDLATGRVARLSLRAPTAAVFLDRDGTVNREKGRISNPLDLELLPDAGAAIARLNRSAYRTVIVTNQAVVARGDCSMADLKRIHNRLETLLGAQGAFVDRIYFCPHIPDRGFPGERLELKVECDCRKPGIGMVRDAARDLNLDLGQSWLIGDSSGDVETARRAGAISILLTTGLGGRDGKWRTPADLECHDLADAVDLILERWPAMRRRVEPLTARIEPNQVVLLGGQARAGKSHHAAALRRALIEAGKPAVVIALDHWLRSAGERPGNTVLDRYDLASASAFVRQAARRAGSHVMPRYDRHQRRSVAAAYEIDIPEGAVLIVEGVPALASDELAALGHLRVAMTSEETRRRAAIRRDYHARGWTPAMIDELLEQRLREEFPVIQASLGNASVELNNGPAP